MKNSSIRAHSIYVHWPFCVSKCPYCDFNSHVRQGVNEDIWRDALLTDLRFEALLTPESIIRSIFFGGGTPSLMPPATVEALVTEVTRLWRTEPDIEITLEANPSSVETSRFADFAAAGVNRVSLGVQSFDDDALRLLGRAHDSDAALRALDIAQRHFPRVSFDLIYGLPAQTTEAWQAELSQALARGTDHLSLYQLTIEPGTRFETLVRTGELVPLDLEVAAALFEETQAITASAGLPAYEISNHARPGEESRHNLTYWRYGDYLGIGPGAHGRRQGIATERHRKPENFLSAVARHGHGVREEEPLSRAQQAREALVMGLRLTEGVDLAGLAARFDYTPEVLVNAEKIAKLEAEGLLWPDTSRLGLAPAGRLLLDAILAEIVAV